MACGPIALLITIKIMPRNIWAWTLNCPGDKFDKLMFLSLSFLPFIVQQDLFKESFVVISEDITITLFSLYIVYCFLQKPTERRQHF